MPLGETNGGAVRLKRTITKDKQSRLLPKLDRWSLKWLHNQNHQDYERLQTKRVDNLQRRPQHTEPAMIWGEGQGTERGVCARYCTFKWQQHSEYSSSRWCLWWWVHKSLINIMPARASVVFDRRGAMYWRQSRARVPVAVGGWTSGGTGLMQQNCTKHLPIQKVFSSCTAKTSERPRRLHHDAGKTASRLQAHSLYQPVGPVLSLPLSASNLLQI